MQYSPDQQNTDSADPKSPLGDRHVMRLFGQYRFFLLTALALVYYISDTQSFLGKRDALLFEVAHLGYAVAALAFIYVQRMDWFTQAARQHLQNYLDITFICIMMYACGGVQSGFGILLVITIALLSQINSTRYALFFAAIASVMVLLEELVAQMLISSAAADFERAAFLASMLFLVAWLLTVPLRELSSRQLSKTTKNRASLDIKQIAQLNEEIIRELDSGVLVLDDNQHVILMNDTARELLACEQTLIPTHIGRLNHDLAQHIKSGSLSANTIDVEANGLSLIPRNSTLPSGGMLVKLDDHAHIKKQYQQLKLASLGRLSASIAHEIRNPLGAISHAVQLLQESEHLDAEDRKLIDIADSHTHRIDRIVDDVLQLSNRQLIRSEPLDLGFVISDFVHRFTSEQQLEHTQITASVQPSLYAVFDPDHLDQVLWNLCTNAILHNDNNDIIIAISCWQTQYGAVIVDIVDDGVGISDIHRENLFEPFYSTHHNGSGLGLFIISELCELNKADIQCIERAHGAHFRLTLNNAQRMAA